MPRATSSAQTEGSVLSQTCLNQRKPFVTRSGNKSVSNITNFNLDCPTTVDAKGHHHVHYLFYMSVIILSFSAKTRPATKLPFTAVCCQDATSMSFAMQWPAACQARFALLPVYAVVFCCCSQKRYAITPSCVAPVRPKQLAYRRLCNKAWPLTWQLWSWRKCSLCRQQAKRPSK